MSILMALLESLLVKTVDTGGRIGFVCAVVMGESSSRGWPNTAIILNLAAHLDIRLIALGLGHLLPLDNSKVFQLM